MIFVAFPVCDCGAEPIIHPNPFSSRTTDVTDFRCFFYLLDYDGFPRVYIGIIKFKTINLKTPSTSEVCTQLL